MSNGKELVLLDYAVNIHQQVYAGERENEQDEDERLEREQRDVEDVLDRYMEAELKKLQEIKDLQARGVRLTCEHSNHELFSSESKDEEQEEESVYNRKAEEVDAEDPSQSEMMELRVDRTSAPAKLIENIKALVKQNNLQRKSGINNPSSVHRTGSQTLGMSRLWDTQGYFLQSPTDKATTNSGAAEPCLRTLTLPDISQAVESYSTFSNIQQKKSAERLLKAQRQSKSSFSGEEDLTLFSTNLSLEEENNRLKKTIGIVHRDFSAFLDCLTEIKNENFQKMQELKEQKKDALETAEGVPEEEEGNDNKMFITDSLWKVVVTIMSGIERSVRTYDYEKKQYNLSEKDFSMKNIFEVHLPSFDGSQIAKFVDYAPTIFHYIRKIHGIFPESYTKSLGPESLSKIITGNMGSFQGQDSSGKSGSFFFTSSDKKFLVKTLKLDEFDLLLSILPWYLKYLIENPQTMISKLFGLHRIVLKDRGPTALKQKWVIIVMENIFATNVPIHSMFDLKGSTYNRRTKQEKLGSSAGKDLNFLDLKTKFPIPRPIYEAMTVQINKDAKFLEECNIIDYSLLLGVHDRQKVIDSPEEDDPLRVESNFVRKVSSIKSSVGPAFDETLLWNPKQLNPMNSSDGRFLLYFGIIDTLTHFNLKKKGEYITKRLFQGKGASCVPPKQYANRFIDFMVNSVFVPQEIRLEYNLLKDDLKASFIGRSSPTRRSLIAKSRSAVSPEEGSSAKKSQNNGEPDSHNSIEKMNSHQVGSKPLEGETSFLKPSPVGFSLNPKRVNSINP